MTGWFEKMKEAFGGGAEAKAAAVRMIRHAQRATIELVPELESPAEAYTATIEQVREEDFVISQPSIGGLTHPLRTGERFLITVEGPKGKVTGQTRVVGRHKTQSGGSAVFFGYRMTMPPMMMPGNVHDFRASKRKRA